MESSTKINGAKTIFGQIAKNSSPNLKLAGEAILLASIGFSIASVEMSSKFSVKNFSKDQKTLQAASTALDLYLVVGGLWALGVCLMLYGSYSTPGLIWGLITNVAVLLWIMASYLHAFKQATDQHDVLFPRCFFGLINPHYFPADFETNEKYRNFDAERKNHKK
jgi:hypothetical protein